MNPNLSRAASALVLIVATPSWADAPPGGGNQPPPGPCVVTVIEALWTPAHLLRPLSTSRATTRRPTLTWSSCAEARVQICADRSCSTVLSSADVATKSYTPSSDLTGNGDVYFWRVQNKVGASVGAWSPVWQVNVPAVSAPFSTSGGSVLDVNLDGKPEFAVGDHGYEAVRGEAAGAVHVYSPGRSVPTTPTWTLSQPVPVDGSLFGGELGTAGDVNGDGFADLVVGANYAPDPSNVETGAAYVFFGGVAGFGSAPTELYGASPEAFGYAVSAAGDVNGDGYGDVLVGAIAGGAEEGEAFVYHGRAGSSPTLQLGATLTGSGAFGSQFGVNVSGVGDLNGDGYGDIAVGESHYEFWSGGHPAGKVFVWYGGPNGITGAGIEVVSPDSSPGDGFGFALSGAGDVNGDGYHDLVVGSSGANGDDGAAYAWYGGPTGIDPTSPSEVFDPPTAQSGFFGHSVSAAGDLDRDGVDDLVIGETDADRYEGRVHVYRSSASRVSIASPNPTAGDYFGNYGAIVGDVDANGHDDFLIGGGGVAYLFPSDNSAPSVGDALPLGPASPTFGSVGR